MSCSLYDEFEAAATKKKQCKLTYLEEDKEKTVSTKIVNFRSFERQEFMIIEDGTLIRLDRVLAFNGKDTKQLNCYLSA
ncbi:MAG: hypothetical protein ACNI25_15510 [Halarcobacter sp.]